jgi:ABC-type amino acid transport substrate-binding protein
MSRRLVFFSLAALLLAGLLVDARVRALARARPPREAWTEVRARGRLLVGTDPTYMPFSGYAGDYTGLEPELMRAVAARLGVEIQFFGFGGDGLYEALAVAQVDALASQIVIEPQRSGQFRYSAPYFDAGEVLVVRAGGAPGSAAELGGRTVAVELGSDGDAIARRLARQLAGGLTLLHTEEPAAALEAVAAGTADGAIVDRLSALEGLAVRPGLALQPEPLASKPYAIVVRADSPELHRRIAAVLVELEADGTLAALREKWLP